MVNQRASNFKKQLYGSHYWYKNVPETSHSKNNSNVEIKKKASDEKNSQELAGRPLISALIAELEKDDEKTSIHSKKEEKILSELNP